MTNDHWRSWTCPLGCAENLTTHSLLSEHIEHQHGLKIASPDIVSHTRPNFEQAKGMCPLCEEFDIATSHQYQSHVGTHLEQLSLFVLPRSEECQEESKEDKSDESDGDGGSYDLTRIEKAQTEAELTKEIKKLEAHQKRFVEKLLAANVEALEAETEPSEARQKLLEANQKPVTDQDQEFKEGSVKFRDAVGRKYTFPWRLASKWKVQYVY